MPNGLRSALGTALFTIAVLYALVVIGRTWQLPVVSTVADTITGAAA